jgi:DNA-binding GntR family transcriptional regulator
VAKLSIRLKRNTDETLHAQVSRQINDSIKSGKLKPGASLPSTQSLGKQLGISPETVRRAYIQLRDKKLITREDGLGYQVRGRPPTVKASPVTKAPPAAKGVRARAA